MPNKREKLIELFESADKQIHLPYMMNTEQARRYIFQEMADHLIANGVTLASSSKQVASSKWISVTERLPIHFGQFLVTVKEYNRGCYADSAMYDPYRNEWRTNLFCGMRDEVTHWMHLPEPPKGE